VLGSERLVGTIVAVMNCGRIAVPATKPTTQIMLNATKAGL
jgi:hypothetical protein